jgi:alanyl-tRNA synthetase
LGYPKEFLAQMAGAVTASLRAGYPLLEKRLADVESALRREEQTFVRTLDRGSELLEQLIKSALADGSAQLDGESVFRLHDTFGFPSELTREVAGERGVAVDMDGFDAKMREQRERARADAKSKRAVVNVADLPALRSTFEGYGGRESTGSIRSMLVDGAPVDVLEAGAHGQLVLDRTSFYAEKGGQIGDHGTIIGDDGTFEVSDTQYVGDAIAHTGRVVSGSFVLGSPVRTAVDPTWREEIRRHHTSAHLLQRALREVLGEEVVQAGSWVGTDRMRFDFRSPVGALSATQKRAVTQRVNELIRADYTLETHEMPIAQAQQSGAISMAGEKYGDLVRVVRAGPAVEFCGGTHALTTGELGLFVIVNEASIGSGVRRIEAVVSKAAETYVEKQQDVIAELAETLSAKPDDLVGRVNRLQSDVRDLQKSLADINARLAVADAKAYVERAETINGTTLVAAVVREADAHAVRTLAGAIRSRLSSGVITLVGVDGQTVTLFASVSDDAVKAGVHAGNLVRAGAPLVGGKGGGAPAQAQGGGKNVAGAEAALAAMRHAIA